MKSGDHMKIGFKGSKEEFEKVKQKLNDNDYVFVFGEGDYELRQSLKNISSIIGRKNDDFTIIPCTNVVFVEAFGHDLVCHTIDGVYDIALKLYELDGMFERFGFIRCHKSYVVNINMIKRIKPEFNRKFKLVMKNDKVIEVSRSYYDNFKNFIGM